jgi:preprotein translocase subunit SecD
LSLKRPELNNSVALRGDNIGALLHHLGDAPGASKRIIVQLGQAESFGGRPTAIRRFRNEKDADEALDLIFKYVPDIPFWPQLPRRDVREGMVAQFSENATAADKSAAISRALVTIEKRIDTYGVTQPVIQKLGEDLHQAQDQLHEERARNQELKQKWLR